MLTIGVGGAVVGGMDGALVLGTLVGDAVVGANVSPGCVGVCVVGVCVGVGVGAVVGEGVGHGMETAAPSMYRWPHTKLPPQFTNSRHDPFAGVVGPADVVTTTTGTVPVDTVARGVDVAVHGIGWYRQGSFRKHNGDRARCCLWYGLVQPKVTWVKDFAKGTPSTMRNSLPMYT